MGLITNTLGSNPGNLFGGIRSRVAEILGLQADTFRTASQNQEVEQSGRAFSGASVTNELIQTEGITQTATSENRKNITILDADPDSVPAGFDSNFLRRVLTQVNAQDFLSRSVLNLNQRQRVNQNGFAQGEDALGNLSTVVNTLTQDSGNTTQTATSRVNTNIDVQRDPVVEDAALLRETRVTVGNSLLDAGVFVVQDQGTPDDPSVQTGRADGGVVENFLNQNANGTQNNNVFMQNTIDVSQDETDTVLSQRSNSVLVRIENDIVRNHGIIVQNQALRQIAEAGVDEFGNPTGNGGTVNNVARQTSNFTDNSVAVNTTTILA